jgi:hypothetical protein
MVDSIHNIPGSEIKLQEGKNSNRKNELKREIVSTGGKPVDLFSKESDVSGFNQVGIAEADANAGLELGRETAYELSRQTSEEIRNNPNMAESAQANISGQRFLDLSKK